MKTNNTKWDSSLAHSLPEKYDTREKAENRAEYLRIGTYANSYVEQRGNTFVVVKVK